MPKFAIVISNDDGPETDEDRGTFASLADAMVYARSIAFGEDPSFPWANAVRVYPVEDDGWTVNYGVDAVGSVSAAHRCTTFRKVDGSRCRKHAGHLSNHKFVEAVN